MICTHDYGLNHEDFSDIVGDAWDKDPQVVYEDIRPFVEREGLVPDESIDPKSIWGDAKKTMKVAILNDTHCGVRNSSEIMMDYQEKFYRDVFFRT